MFALIFLAVLANVCYCAAYAVDLFVQYAGLRAAWARRRWMLLMVVEQMQERVPGKLREMGFPGFLSFVFTRKIPRLSRWKDPG